MFLPEVFSVQDEAGSRQVRVEEEERRVMVIAPECFSSPILSRCSVVLFFFFFSRWKVFAFPPSSSFLFWKRVEGRRGRRLFKGSPSSSYLHSSPARFLCASVVLFPAVFNYSCLNET